MTKDKTVFLLKKDWLGHAEMAKKSAAGWKKAADKWTKENSFGWSKAECEAEFAAYMKKYNDHIERAKSAPVKIVLHFEDGRTETIE